MNREDKDGFITLDATVSDSLLSANDSLNSSKRKVDDSDSDCVVESIHPRKKLCQDAIEDGNSVAESQIVTVVFGSQDIARKYSKEITDFVSQLTKSEITTSVEKDGKPCLEFYKSVDEQPGNQDDDIQFVDNGQANSVDTLPQYDQSFTGVFGVPSEEKGEEKAKPKNVCFNCEGDHMIAACPEPRDSARIAKNRREHVNKNPSYNRYHEEADQKFGHLVPGSISDGLREALGLRDSDLPLHTYRMRVQGYPPGWLLAARLQRSNISVHHEPKPDSDKDPKKANEKEEDHYDVTKLISFPGFNVGYPDGFRDDYKRKGFPPMQSYWALQSMKKRLGTSAGRRSIHHSKKAADLPADNKADKTQDMDVVKDGDSPDTGGTSTEENSNGAAGSTREGSPSLEALEEQRRALLDSLDTDEPDEAPLVHAPPPAAHSTPQVPVLTPGASRRRELGTPVAAGGGHLVYDADKWSAGITEHIPYENLPGATGAWTRMSNLMKKVRDQLTGSL